MKNLFYALLEIGGGFWVVFVWLVLSMNGCTTMQGRMPDKAQEGQKDEAPQLSSSTGLISDEKEYPVAPFEGDSLYQLLVAEIAGYRSYYDLALEKYIHTAEQTRDPGVAARATRMALYLKNDDIALRSVLIWSDAEPDSLLAHRHAVDLLLRFDRYEEAITHMEQVKDLGGSARFDVFGYQAAGLPSDKRLALLAIIEEMSIRRPDDISLMFSKAVLLQYQGRHFEVLELANEILATEKDVNTIILKKSALESLSQPKEARIFLFDQVKEMPTNRRLRLVLAQLLFEQGDLIEAQAQYESVLEKTPNDGDILFALALIAMQNEKDAEAKRYLERMVRWNSRAGEAHYYLGGLAEKSSKASVALKHYYQVGNGYEFVPAQARIGNLLVKDGLWEEARTHLNQARRQHPDKAQQLLLVEAQLLADRGLEREIFEFIDEVLAKYPDDLEFLYFRAMIGQRFGYLEILESDLRRIIEIDPDNADALNALGYTLADQTDRHEEALKLIEKALVIKPDEAAFIDSMGWVQYRLKNYESAIIHLRKALSLFQNDEVAAHLGEVLWVVGDRIEALEIWKQALEWAPDSEILKAVIQRFRDE